MTKTVRILNKLEESFIDYPDNESLAICVVMMGCVNKCVGCQNPLFQNPDYNKGTRVVSVDELSNELKDFCHRNLTNKIVLSGGDVLSPYNIEFTKELLGKMASDYDICVYTGHNVEYVKEHGVHGFKFLKCGKFDIKNKRESEKTDKKMIFASPNQELYDEEFNLISKDGVYSF